MADVASRAKNASAKTNVINFVYHRDGYRSSEKICMRRLSRWVRGASWLKTPC